MLVPLLSVLVIGTAAFVTHELEQSRAKPLTASQTEPVIRSWEYVDGFPMRISVFQTVFWEPRDTDSLRELIETTDLVHGKRVLEIGTGSGLVALCCLREGAAQVVATDVNPNAIENVRYNARVLDVAERLEARFVGTPIADAFAVIGTEEKFDLIVSNPPWENAVPRTTAEFALYDKDFQLLESILAGARARLNPGGRLLLAYGCREALERIAQLCREFDLNSQQLDPRSLSDLPDVFVPGMLVEILPPQGHF